MGFPNRIAFDRVDPPAISPPRSPAAAPDIEMRQVVAPDPPELIPFLGDIVAPDVVAAPAQAPAIDAAAPAAAVLPPDAAAPPPDAAAPPLDADAPPPDAAAASNALVVVASPTPKHTLNNEHHSSKKPRKD